MKRQPLRTCIVCHGKHDKQDLVRYVWNDAGPLVDLKQVMAGRGGYCCNRDTCLSQVALSERRLKRAFRLDNGSS